VAAVIDDRARDPARRAGILPALLRPHRRGVNANAPTPDWMKRRIERSGIRSISAWSMSPTT
jgi:phenylalanyl-tRNA synthetase beta chain